MFMDMEPVPATFRNLTAPRARPRLARQLIKYVVHASQLKSKLRVVEFGTKIMHSLRTHDY